MENTNVKEMALCLYLEQELDKAVKTHYSQTSLKDYKPFTSKLVIEAETKAAKAWIAENEDRMTENDFRYLVDIFGDEAFFLIDHYEVVTYTNHYLDDTNTVDSFFEYKDAKEFFDSLDDDNKALIKVDKDGLSIDDAEENEYQRVY